MFGLSPVGTIFLCDFVQPSPSQPTPNDQVSVYSVELLGSNYSNVRGQRGEDRLRSLLLLNTSTLGAPSLLPGQKQLLLNTGDNLPSCIGID